MRIKYIKTNDLAELESTVNNLLSLGWEINSALTFHPDGGYVLSMSTYDRRPAYYREANCTAQEVAERAALDVASTAGYSNPPTTAIESPEWTLAPQERVVGHFTGGY